VNSSRLEELFTVFDFDICLAVACDGVLNSSVFYQTTHTHTGRTGAEHYNNYHQTLIVAIISTISDLSIQIIELANISFERINAFISSGSTNRADSFIHPTSIARRNYV
jgi:hypothetical protein